MDPNLWRLLFSVNLLGYHCRKVSSGPFWVSPRESMGIRDDFWLGSTRLINRMLFRAQFAQLKRAGLGAVAPAISPSLISYSTSISPGPLEVSPAGSIGIINRFRLDLTRLFDRVFSRAQFALIKMVSLGGVAPAISPAGA